MSAPIVSIFKREWTETFQQKESILRPYVNSSAETEGGEVVWTVASAAPRMAERGVDGKIPAVQRLDTQFRANLRELTHKEIRTGFDIFVATLSQRTAMINAGNYAAKREIDQYILEILGTTTNTINGAGVVGGAAAAVTVAGVAGIAENLMLNLKAPDEDVCFLWTPRAWARLHTFTEFANADWVGTPGLNGRKIKGKDWMFGTHMHMPDLPGVGTTSALGFAFHKEAIGHAIGNGEPIVKIGNDDEDQYAYMSIVLMHAARILQPGGVWRIALDA